jgi:lipopolysaccharide export system permease protein
MRYVSEGRFTSKEAVVYIVTMLPKIFIEVSPIAVLLGSLLTISTMASNLEIISLKTSGISFLRICCFPIILAGIISMMIFVVNDKIYPGALKEHYRLRSSKSVDKEEVLPIEKENAFVRGENGNHIYFMKKINRNTGFGEYIVIIDFNKDFNKRERIILAPSGRYNFTKDAWDLKDAQIYLGDSSVPEKTSGIFSDSKYSENPDKFITADVNPKTLNLDQLKKAAQDAKTTGMDTRNIMVELGKRYSFPFSSFIVVFFGLALGSRYVKSTSAISIGLCICFGYGYYVIQGIFESYSKNGLVNSFVGGWIPNILFLIIGFYFMRRSEF